MNSHISLTIIQQERINDLQSLQGEMNRLLRIFEKAGRENDAKEVTDLANEVTDVIEYVEEAEEIYRAEPDEKKAKEKLIKKGVFQSIKDFGDKLMNNITDDKSELNKLIKFVNNSAAATAVVKGIAESIAKFF